MIGIVKMGCEGDIDVVVDSSFKVLGGIIGLWVVDMSVVLVLLSVYIQVVVYVIGLICVDKFVEEYGL